MIPYGRQIISEADIEAVKRVLTSDFLTQGPQVPAFEGALAAYVGAAHAVAVNSATSALHIACLAMGLGPGDRLWTSPNTFVASANVGRLCGAEVDFVDVDARTYNMCVVALSEKLSQAEREGTLPKIVMPVHFAGQSCDMAAIGALATQYGFAVIEDASHAIGASYGGAKVGACIHSDICVFSFHPVKIITTAEGGAATTNDQGLSDKMRRLASHGVTRDADLWHTNGPQGPWAYQQIDLGLNYRMTELQAALGLSQLSRVDAFVETRHEIFRTYANALAGLDIGLPYQGEDQHSALHLYPIQVANRAEVFASLRGQGIGVNVHYIPVHIQPYYQALGFKPGDFPNAETYYAKAISLPLHPGLSKADMYLIQAALEQALT